MNENKKKFICIRCGCCCKAVGHTEEDKFLDNGNGVCKYYNDQKRECIIYNFRPEICRVDKMYKRFKDKMTWDEYVDLTYESCEKLRKLDKEGKLGKIIN